MRRELLAGLELGSTKISCVIGTLGRDGKLSALGAAAVAHHGVRQGQVSDLASLVGSIEEAVRGAESKAGTDIQQAFVSVSHPAIRSLRSRGVLTLAERAATIRHREIQRVTEQAELRAISLDHELLHAIPLGFTIDDQEGVDNPAGLLGTKLAVEMHLVTLPQSLAQNVVKAISQAGVDVERLVYTGCATVLVTLTEEERQLGALLMDIGGSTTDVVVTERGRVTFVETLPWGGERLTDAVIRQLKVSAERAEQLKRTFQWSSRSKAAEVIRQELSAMVSTIAETLRTAGVTDAHLVQAVVAGRSALLDGLVEHWQEALQVPIRIGHSHDARLIINGETGLAVITGLGLLEYGKRFRLGRLPLHLPATSLWGRLRFKAQEVFQEYF